MFPRLLSLLLLFPFAVRAAEPFEIKDGDRVLFLGDTLLEREGTYGHLETRMHEQFPDRHFTVRNLAFSADTPLGWSRASFDPAAVGFERLKEQIALVRPTVVFLGYGMAASLQEMTDRASDPTLNPDPARYGAEPMSAGRFKRELGQLMDAIRETARAGTPAERAPTADAPPVRFVLLSPIRHEDLRATRPALPDPAEHNRLLERYARAIEKLAKERGARFLNFFAGNQGERFALHAGGGLTDNGIHLNNEGYAVLVSHFTPGLHWSETPRQGRSQVEAAGARSATLRAAIIRKNELFFHQWRPANSTYLFGFRKHEQGQNAKEMPMFDPLIAAAEAEIDRLKRGGAGEPKSADHPAATPATARQDARPPSLEAAPTLPKPDFTVAEGYQIELWAENPLLYKPTQMNWDAQGRLWVASSALYPQIAPGGAASDTVLILEDTDRDGKADKSKVFAEGLLIPTGVVPDGGSSDLTAETQRTQSAAEGNTRRPTLPQNPSAPLRLNPVACFVAQSTELLHFTDTDGDGLADQRRVVLSGFGTEDTHHIIHTLKWGPDGRLYFNQSVYIHSHVETPWGIVRLNSGGVFAWDPRTEKLEVYAKGLWNTWGLQFDKWGQSFQTDGAGSTAITWSFPGATFAPFEGSRRTLPSISPGAYPKFCGLEIIYSPHFPADWQGNAVTCDFRAHRIVRFGITDLAQEPHATDAKVAKENGAIGQAAAVSDPSRPLREAMSGYTTSELPDLVRTSDVSFRPIDVKLGPDGALYIADWSNPVINHGEVDFRDPRRDHTHGRIWRISRKDAPGVKWEPLAGQSSVELLARSENANLWEREQSRALLGGNPALQEPDFASPHPRARLAALRALARIPTAESAALVLDAAVGSARAPRAEAGASPGSGKTAPPAARTPEPAREARALPDPTVLDPFLDFAAWQSINDLAVPWTAAIADGTWKIEGRERQLEYGLSAIDPALAGATLAMLLKDAKISLNKGPWIELVGKTGGPKELAAVFESLIISFGADCCSGRNMIAPRATSFSEAEAVRGIAALLEVVRVRDVRPEGELALAELAAHAPAALRPGLTQLAGYWKTDDAAQFLPALATAADTKPELRLAAIEALRALGGPVAQRTLESLCAPGGSFAMRRSALVALAAQKFPAAAPYVAPVLRDAPNENEALATWRQLLAVQGAAGVLEKKFSDAAWIKELPQPVIVAAFRAAREAGRKGQSLAQVLTPLAGASAAQVFTAADYQRLAAATKQSGDPAQGELIYRRTASGCVTCHAIGGAGGLVGPALTSIGASAPLDYIVESMLTPNAKVKEGYNAVTLKLKDGTEVTGIAARETAQEIIVRNIAGQETAVPKANITGKTEVGSIMPAGLLEQLSDRERLNLYAFLGELGKPGPYDASKGSVARVWRLYASAQEAPALKQDVTAAYVPAAYTHVDGRLLQEALTEALSLLGDDAPSFYVTAQFQVATAGKVRLGLAGIRTAWLDGQPLAVASEPNPAPELAPGVHTLAVKLDRSALPVVLRAEADGVNFLGN